MAGSELKIGDGSSVHLDEDGAPCSRHTCASSSGIMHLATVGSRALAVQHDLASKLQSLMMAIEEVGDLAAHPDVSPDLREAAAVALGALAQVNDMFAASRAFARRTDRTRVSIAELLTRGARRTGVTVDVSTVGDVDVNVVAPTVEHALSLLLDVLSADLDTSRRVRVSAEVTATEVVVTLLGNGPGQARPQATDLVAIATYAIARDHGEVRCGRPGENARFIIRFPE
jgi:hypothetical protein